MLTVTQVAERLNCSVSTIYGLITSGRLEHHRCPGVRVSEEQLKLIWKQQSGDANRKFPGSLVSDPACGTSASVDHDNPATNGGICHSAARLA